jgi:hypothetical protein
MPGIAQKAKTFRIDARRENLAETTIGGDDEIQHGH